MTDFVHITGPRVLLRDPLPADALWDFRWGTVETAWQDWDAPWENGPVRPVCEFSADDILRSLQRGFADFDTPPPTPRAALRVDAVGGPPLGWVNHYHYDPAARLTWAGIDLCESAYWGRGLGTEAFRLWLGYLFTHRELDRIGLGTWSGNARMIRLAEKCGFVLTHRNVGNREVRGQTYDGLGFMLTRESWDGWIGEER